MLAESCAAAQDRAIDHYRELARRMTLDIRITECRRMATGEIRPLMKAVPSD